LPVASTRPASPGDRDCGANMPLFKRRDAAMQASAALAASLNDNVVWVFVESVDIPHGAFRCDVVGESHYQDDLLAICGEKLPGRHVRRTTAALIRQTDNPYDQNAVAVHIAGRHVGYLSRDNAATVSPILATRPAVVVEAWITGGWDDGAGDVGFFGVVLAMPPPDEL
jgi:HIRAN domain